MSDQDDELLAIDHDEDEDAPEVDISELGEGPALDAHGLPHIKDVLALLRRDVRERHISWLPGKENRNTGVTGAPIPYIAWPTACDYMDHFAVWWDYEIVSVIESTNYYIVHSRVVVHHSNGQCPRDGLGWEAKNATGFGGPLPNAESQSIRRALAKFGLARSLYQKGKQPHVPQEVRAALQPPKHAKPNPPAPTPASSNGSHVGGDGSVGGRIVKEDRFHAQWLQLKEWGWTGSQLTAQYEKLGGRDKFTELSDAFQDRVIQRFDELLAVEAKAQKAQAAKVTK